MKKSALAALRTAAGHAQPATPPAVQLRATATTVFIGGQFPPEVRNALKLAEAYSGKRLKPLLAEAFNHICAKYGVPEPCTGEE